VNQESVNDLIAFLKEAIDEDERMARNAGADEWWVDDEDGEVCRSGGYDVARTPKSYYSAHIAEHDPARVLREVRWKRRIFDHHVKVADGSQSSWAWFMAYSETESEDALRELAAVYADRPGYREEWAIQ
jgi:hypothetical protein